MAPTLYMIPPSAPVRAVQITAKALGLQLNEKQVDFLAQQQFTPEYLKINPQHTVPTLVEEDGFNVWDSHAINAYLVSKYGKNDSLYPKDLKKRAVVDQRLHFDNGVAFATVSRIIYPTIQGIKTRIEEEDKKQVEEIYQYLEAFLEGKSWIAGDSLTIADYSLYATITSCNILVPVDAKFPKLNAWLKKVDALPEVEVSRKGLEALAGIIKSNLK